MRAAGSEVVLVTLPGLYASDRDPSSRALEIGHLPTFTDNPFVLARMAERYNDQLRALARERGLVLVDLDAWCRRELQPPEDHFVDTVHLDERAQERAGVFLAQALAPLLSQERRARLLGTTERYAGRAGVARSAATSAASPSRQPRGA